MNSYIDLTLHQTQSGLTNEMVLHGSANTLLGNKTDNNTENSNQQTVLSGDYLAAGEFLSPTQEEYFLELFWEDLSYLSLPSHQ